MKIIFIKDDRLREILADRNREIKRLLLSGKLKGTLSVKLSTSGAFFGWEITDNENGYKVERRFGEKKEEVKPCGTVTALKDSFKPIENIGVFKKED